MTRTGLTDWQYMSADLHTDFTGYKDVCLSTEAEVAFCSSKGGEAALFQENIAHQISEEGLEKMT